MDVTNLPVARAKLPVAYERAKDALLKCSTIDECAEWKNKAEAIASYARQSDDETLLNTAMRIKARAIKRCGELLKAIEPGKAGRPQLTAGKSIPAPVQISRSSTAADANLSKRKKDTALAVASIPDEEFERAVEGPGRPPTVTELAKRGTKPAAPKKPPSTDHLEGRDPKDFEASTRAQAALRSFAETASKVKPQIAVRGAVPSEYSDMAADATAAARWIAEVLRELKRVKK